MKEHLVVLDLAAQDKLPDNIDGASHVSVAIVQELVDAGYLKAIDASSFEGLAFVKPRITIAGREYLAQLKDKRKEIQMKAKRHGEASTGSPTHVSPAAHAWIEMEREYGVSKRSFSRKISFVRDQFKRKIIFRDMEQAFFLASNRFNKPAVIIAGGVIEELLRLYIESKKVKSQGNTLDSYIKTCEEKGILKKAVFTLANSFREFRNLVHLQREESPRHSISTSTAKSAVASVFTIINDFDT